MCRLKIRIYEILLFLGQKNSRLFWIARKTSKIVVLILEIRYTWSFLISIVNEMGLRQTDRKQRYKFVNIFQDMVFDVFNRILRNFETDYLLILYSKWSPTNSL